MPEEHGQVDAAEESHGKFRDRLTRALAEYIDRSLPDVDRVTIETRIVDDAPARAILQTADTIDADLIVMGTHGRTGWRRLLHGSVAEKIVHHIDRSVLCIPPDTQPSIRKILCPVDFTPTARVALEEACALAAAFDAELRLVHVADALGDGPDVEGEFTAWIDPSVRDRCRYTHVLAIGHAAEETFRLAHESHADLIVLGSHHKRFADASVIGATTERVVRFRCGWWGPAGFTLIGTWHRHMLDVPLLLGRVAAVRCPSARQRLYISKIWGPRSHWRMSVWGLEMPKSCDADLRDCRRATMVDSRC